MIALTMVKVGRQRKLDAYENIERRTIVGL